MRRRRRRLTGGATLPAWWRQDRGGDEPPWRARGGEGDESTWDLTACESMRRDTSAAARNRGGEVAAARSWVGKEDEVRVAWGE